MGKVILDDATLAKLAGPNGSVSVCDERGNIVGYFQVVVEDLSWVELPGPDPFSDEEIERALADPSPGRPLADILADLRKL